MNLNFCVKWLRQTASGASPISDCRFKIADCWQLLSFAAMRDPSFQSAIINLKSAME
jgi:hypothetical protein